MVVAVVKNSSPWRRSRCNCTPPVADSSKASKQESNITFCVKNILLQGSARLELIPNLFDHIVPTGEALPPSLPKAISQKGWPPQNFGWTTPSFDVTIVPPAIKRHIFASKQRIVACGQYTHLEEQHCFTMARRISFKSDLSPSQLLVVRVRCWTSTQHGWELRYSESWETEKETGDQEPCWSYH